MKLSESYHHLKGMGKARGVRPAKWSLARGQFEVAKGVNFRDHATDR
jgi:hypothetical protein